MAEVDGLHGNSNSGADVSFLTQERLHYLRALAHRTVATVQSCGPLTTKMFLYHFGLGLME